MAVRKTPSAKGSTAKRRLQVKERKLRGIKNQIHILERKQKNLDKKSTTKAKPTRGRRLKTKQDYEQEFLRKVDPDKKMTPARKRELLKIFRREYDRELQKWRSK